MQHTFKCTLFLVLILSVLTGAQTWKQTYLPGWNEVRAVCVNHDKTKVFIGTEEGVYVSSDNGVNWSKSNSGWGTDNQVNQLLIRGNNIYASTYSNIYVSYNDGISWTKLNPGWSSNSTLWSFAVSGQNITTGYYTFYVSTDYSINNLSISTNNGQTWSRISNPWNGNIFTFHWVNSNLFVGTSSDGVYFSSNNGTSWTEVNNGLPPNSYVKALITTGWNNLYAGTNNGIYLSTDYGSNWIAVNNGFVKLAPHDNVQSFTATETSLFAGTLGGGIFISNHNAENWTRINANWRYDNITVYSLATNSTDLFAGTKDGVYQIKLTDISTSIKSTHNKQNDKFVLRHSKIKSNQFISFDIPNGEDLSVELYSINGKRYRITKNFDDGVCSIHLNKQHTPKGIYVLQIKSNSTYINHRLVLQ